MKNSVSASTVLAADVANNGTFTLAYPSGSVQADFTGDFANATDEEMIVNNNDAYDGTLVDIAYGASLITVTNKTGATLTAGSAILLRLAKADVAPYQGPKAAAITAPTGGATVDAECRAAVTSLIAAVKAAGITA
jgi:hypothetical protein